MPAPTRRVWVFGPLRVEDEDGARPILGAKAQALFAFLILHPHTAHTREALADLLWPESPPERARRSLSDSLYRLRQSLGDEWLSVEGELIALKTEAGLWVDAWEFERGAQSDDPARLEPTAELYVSDLLPGLYDDWVIPRRAALQERYFSIVQRLGQIAERDGHWDRAHAHYQHLARADPLREEAHRGVMRSLAGLRRPREALASYDELRRVLAVELKAEPDEATRALADQLRREMNVARVAAQRRPAPFVGRIGERAQLLARLERARSGSGGFVILLGEAGIGKTRLLHDLALAAGWRGWQVAWGRAEEFSLPPAYAPLGEALEASLPKPRLQQLAQLIQPIWLSIVAGWLPRLAESLRPYDPTSQAADPRQLPLAIRHVLSGLGRIGPHLLILDDVQWADPALWSLSESLREGLAGAPVLIALSGRLDELRAQPAAWSHIDQWDRAGNPTLHLSGLSADELWELAAGISEAEVPPDQRARLQAASNGNPLLAMALVKHGDMSRALANPTLAELMQRQVSRLSAAGRAALEAAAVAGFRFDFALWQAITEPHGLDGQALAERAAEIEGLGLLVMEAEGYRFAHDTLRAYVYGQLPAEQRRTWHRAALAALARLLPDETLSLLNHALQSEDHDAVSRYALQAGRQALRGSAYRAAADYFTRALAAAPPGDRRARFEALNGRVEVLRVLADSESLPDDLRTLRSLADGIGDPAFQAQAALQHARYLWQVGDYDAAQGEAARGLALAPDEKQRADLGSELGRILRDRGDYAEAQAQFEQALARYRRLDDEAGIAGMSDMLGIVAQRQGRPRDAVAAHAEAVEVFHRLGELRSESHALGNLGVACWVSGDHARARDTFERVIPIARELGDVRAEAATLVNLSGLAGAAGHYDRALELQTAALELASAANNRHFVSSVLNSLADSHHQLGDLEQALAHYDEALRLNRELGRRRGEGYAQHGRGEVLLDARRWAEARAALEAARRVREELAERDNLAITLAALVLAHLEAGEVTQAEAVMQSALSHFDTEQDSPETRRDLHYSAYRLWAAKGDLAAALEHLRAAEAAVQTIAASLVPDDREKFLRDTPRNRRVLDATALHSTLITVRLARADVPLGRALAEADFATVTWTLAAPGDEAITDPTARRRRALQRLLAEAAAQNAAPTDGDLASALGVSRRTIVRDMAALARSGARRTTRRRRA